MDVWRITARMDILLPRSLKSFDLSVRIVDDVLLIWESLNFFTNVHGREISALLQAGGSPSFSAEIMKEGITMIAGRDQIMCHLIHRDGVHAALQELKTCPFDAKAWERLHCIVRLA
jgi:hypothetical protein